MERISAAVSVVFLTACVQLGEQPSSAPVREITSRQVNGLLQNKTVVLLDVRSADERLAGKVTGAVELLFGPSEWTKRPVTAADVRLFMIQLRNKFPETETRLIAFCNVGIRSRAAARALVENGYMYVMSVRDGFLGNRFGEGLQAQLF